MTYRNVTQPPLYTSTDNVRSPPHYTKGAIECIEAIQSALTEEEFRGYCKGNAMKYIWRERHKGGKSPLKKPCGI